MNAAVLSKFVNACYSLASIIACLGLGYLCQQLFTSFPASLFGMIIFTLALQVKIINATKVEQTIRWCIANMGVCFVPAGVGIIEHYQLIKTHGITIVLITFFTTFLVLTIVGLGYQKLEQQQKAEHK